MENVIAPFAAHLQNTRSRTRQVQTAAVSGLETAPPPWSSSLHESCCAGSTATTANDERCVCVGVCVSAPVGIALPCGRSVHRSPANAYTHRRLSLGPARASSRRLRSACECGARVHLPRIAVAAKYCTFTHTHVVLSIT